MANESGRPKESPSFETDTVQADRARDQGLGLGERELNAQGDPGGVRTADEDPTLEDGVSRRPGDGEAIDGSIGVQGSADGALRRSDDV